MKKFAVFDVDGTIFRSSLVLEAVYALIRRGVFPYKARAEFDAQLEAWRIRNDPESYDAYIEAVVDTFGRYIKGISENTFKLVAQAVIDEQKHYTYVYTRNLVKTLKDSGYTLIAISGSPKELVEPFTDQYGFDVTLATIYELSDGVYTGNRTAMHTGKDAILKKIVAEQGLDWGDSVGVGDTRGDIGLLDNVEKPTAFNPDKDLLQAARAKGWQVVIERKNVVYELHPNENSNYQLKA